MMHPMMGRSQHNFVQHSEPGIFDQIVADVNECAVGAIDKHNEKQQFGLNTEKNTDGGANGVSIGRLQEEMRVGH